MTYDELVTKIRDYTEVDSNVLTATIINGFIEDSEFRILRDVDSDSNRRYKTAQVIAGTRFIDEPTDALVIRSLQIVDSDGPSAADIENFYNIETQVLCPNSILLMRKECPNIIVHGIRIP